MRTRARFEKLLKRLPKKPVKYSVWLSDGDEVRNLDTGEVLTNAEWERRAAASGHEIIRVKAPDTNESEDE